MIDDFKFKARPLLMSDFVELDLDIKRAYAVSNRIPPDVMVKLEPVFDAASDYACIIAGQLGINPSEVDTDKYFRLIYKE